MVEFEILEDDGERVRTERQFEPFAFVRKIVQIVEEEEPDRFTVREDGIGRMEFNKGMGGSYRVKFGFHEEHIENQFTFRPRVSVRQGGTQRQGTDLPDLGGGAGEVAGIMQEAFDMLPFEFAEVDAASVGHSHLTDYEFEYETHVESSKIKTANLEQFER